MCTYYSVTLTLSIHCSDLNLPHLIMNKPQQFSIETSSQMLSCLLIKFVWFLVMNNEPSPGNLKEATFLMQNEITKLSALLFLEESFYGNMYALKFLIKPITINHSNMFLKPRVLQNPLNFHPAKIDP